MCEEVRQEATGNPMLIGVLTGLFLADRPSELIDEVYDFCESVGLPTTLADVGIGNASDDDLYRVAEGACANGETIFHEPYPVSPDAYKGHPRMAGPGPSA